MSKYQRKVEAQSVAIIIFGVLITVAGLLIFFTKIYNFLIAGIGLLVLFIGSGLFILSAIEDKSKISTDSTSQELNFDSTESPSRIQYMIVHQSLNPPKRVICMISKILLNDEKDILQCPNCESYYHGDYLRKWINEHNSCPVCKITLKIPEVSAPMNSKDI